MKVSVLGKVSHWNMEPTLSNTYQWLIFTLQEITEGFFQHILHRLKPCETIYNHEKGIYIISILIWNYTAMAFH